MRRVVTYSPRMITDSRTARRRCRCGETLAEVIVVLVLVVVAMLGMAGSSALAMRAVNGHALTRRASEQGRLRIALLESAGCAAAADGASANRTSGLEEHWHVVSRSAAAIHIDDSLSWQASGRPRHLVLHTALLC